MDTAASDQNKSLYVRKGLSVRGGFPTPALTGAHGQGVGPEMFSCAFQAEPSLTLKLLQTKGKIQGTYVRHKGFLNQYKSAPPARAITRSPVHSIHTRRVTTRLLSRRSQKQDKRLCVTPVSFSSPGLHSPNSDTLWGLCNVGKD